MIQYRNLLVLSTALITLSLSSCQNDTVAPTPLTLSSEQAVVTVGSTVTGTITNTSSSPTSWTAIGYSLFNNATASSGNEVTFDQQFNGNITEASYNLGYVDIATVTDASGVSLSDLGATSWAVTTLGINSSSQVGWYNYDRTNRTISPIANRFAVVANNSNLSAATFVYVVQLVSAAGTGTGPYNATVNIKYKRLK